MKIVIRDNGDGKGFSGLMAGICILAMLIFIVIAAFILAVKMYIGITE